MQMYAAVSMGETKLRNHQIPLSYLGILLYFTTSSHLAGIRPRYKEKAGMNKQRTNEIGYLRPVRPS